MPHLIEMEDKFKSNNFEIVGLNTDDESVEAINSFAAQMKLNYQMAYASGDMMQEFLKISKFQGIPQSFLIDREGRLRGVFLGGGPKVIGTMKETVEKIVAE
jgi:peroxiredoxin